MPIYAYKCDACGFAKDILQKMSDAPLEICPSCAQPAFKKQVTAAGFQLKGSGWYATDFKGGGSSPASATAPASSAAAGETASGSEAPAAAKTEAAPATTASSTPAAGS